VEPSTNPGPAANPESFVRLIVTRGLGDISTLERVKGPTVVMAVKPFEGFPESSYTEGVPLALVSVRRNHRDALDPAIKSNNLLNNVLAVREAQAKGAVEGILLNQAGQVAEGASTNVFLVKGGVAIRPPRSRYPPRHHP
jgi:branched-chain amino acid aminotransferase